MLDGVRADRLRHGRRPHLGAARRSPCSASTARRSSAPPRPCRRARGPLVSLRVPPGVDAAEATEAADAPTWRRTRRGARGSTVEQVGQGQPFRADTGSPAYAAMAEAMRVAYAARRCRSPARAARSRCATRSPSLYPRGGDPADRAERAGGADPRGERERLARGAGAAVGRRGAVPAELRAARPEPRRRPAVRAGSGRRLRPGRSGRVAVRDGQPTGTPASR